MAKKTIAQLERENAELRAALAAKGKGKAAKKDERFARYEDGKQALARLTELRSLPSFTGWIASSVERAIDDGVIATMRAETASEYSHVRAAIVGGQRAVAVRVAFTEKVGVTDKGAPVIDQTTGEQKTRAAKTRELFERHVGVHDVQYRVGDNDARVQLWTGVIPALRPARGQKAGKDTPVFIISDGGVVIFLRDTRG